MIGFCQSPAWKVKYLFDLTLNIDLFLLFSKEFHHHSKFVRIRTLRLKWDQDQLLMGKGSLAELATTTPSNYPACDGFDVQEIMLSNLQGHLTNSKPESWLNQLESMHIEIGNTHQNIHQLFMKVLIKHLQRTSIKWHVKDMQVDGYHKDLTSLINKVIKPVSVSAGSLQQALLLATKRVKRLEITVPDSD